MNKIAFEKKVAKTIKKYKLISKKDKVAVAVSGGKDSTTVLYILHKLGYNVTGIILDLLIGQYTKKNVDNITEFCSKKKIPLIRLDIRQEAGYSLCYLRDALRAKGINWKSCTICGTLKKYFLNKRARELGFNVIATGHNMDDELQTILMNFINATPELNAKMGPVAGVIKDKKFVPRIKPLYFCSENDVANYSKSMNFPVVYEACPCSVGVFRRNLREELEELSKVHLKLKENIINWFTGNISKLRDKFKTNKTLVYCASCGEPSRGELCTFCSMMDKLK